MSEIRNVSEGATLVPTRFHLYARYAHAGEKFFASSTPFRQLTLTLDSTGKYPVLTDWSERELRGLPFVRNELDLRGLLDSLRTFRGTLYDGVLQPNVRPAIGLEFSIDSPPKLPPRIPPLDQRELALRKEHKQIQKLEPTPGQIKPRPKISREEAGNSHQLRGEVSSKPLDKKKPGTTTRPQNRRAQHEDFGAGSADA